MRHWGLLKMAIINKLKSIANAIRNKNGSSDEYTLDDMVTEINNLKTTFRTQEKEEFAGEDDIEVTPDQGYDGLSSVMVYGVGDKFVGSGVTKQSAKTITPSGNSQTAVARGVYTTGAVTVAAIPSEYVVPSGTFDIDNNGTYDIGKYKSVNVNVQGGGGGIPGVDLLYSNNAESITYTSTSAGTAKTISGITNLNQYPFLIVTIENTNSTKGSLKFIRSSTVVGNLNPGSTSISATRYGAQQYYNSSGTLTQTSSTTYGLFGYTLTAAGALTIRGRTNSSYYTSLTGTYKVQVLGIKL